MAESAGRGAALDWKTSLQELTAALGLGVPEYRIDEAGPDHAKTFTAWVVVAGRKYGGADGRSKKEAEQRAAEAAWRTLSEQQDEPSAPTAPAISTVDPVSDGAGPVSDLVGPTSDGAGPVDRADANRSVVAASGGPADTDRGNPGTAGDAVPN
ncbi:hypothetical protein GCM10027615_31790 [Plantactinospora veratri]